MTLDDCRRFYAEEIRLAANIGSPKLVEAFARVPRENFLGPGPWKIASSDLGLGATTYITTDDADPRHVYHNVVIALDAARDLNNGQPAALAKWIEALDLKPGSCVYHLGCGVGYYTAVMAELAGAEGQVMASEVDPDLAERARRNLSSYSNVRVHSGDGADFDPGPCDAIFINAGVTHPHRSWLRNLKDGGGMVLPLTVAFGMGMGANLSKGVMAKITRETSGFSARTVSFVAIYSCSSPAVRDPEIEKMLGKALGSGALFKMRSFRQDAHEPNDSCLVHAASFCLSSAEVANKEQAASGE